MSARRFSLFYLVSFAATFSLLSFQTVFAADAPNNKLNYLINGDLVNGWSLQLGDPTNWSTSVSNRNGESASGKVKVEPSDRNAKGDALKVTWDKKPGQGNLGIYGGSVDLSNLENDGALFIEIKVITPPAGNVTIGMDCGYPCGGKVSVSKNLKKLKRNEWDMLPIPLNCFTKEGLDIKKVIGPFTMSTDGKLQIELGEIKLLKLAEGDVGCKTP